MLKTTIYFLFSSVSLCCGIRGAQRRSVLWVFVRFWSQRISGEVTPSSGFLSNSLRRGQPFHHALVSFRPTHQHAYIYTLPSAHRPCTHKLTPWANTVVVSWSMHQESTRFPTDLWPPLQTRRAPCVSVHCCEIQWNTSLSEAEAHWSILKQLPCITDNGRLKEQVALVCSSDWDKAFLGRSRENSCFQVCVCASKRRHN